MSNIIHVQMFNLFSVSYQNQIMNRDSMKSEKLIRLFAYLLSNNKRTIPSHELIDALWYYDEVDNPVGALKNLVYRLRTLIKKSFGLTDLIITGKGTYSINQEYELVVDIDLFEQYNNRIVDHQATHDDYKKCIELYTGKYLSEIADDHTVISKSAYYHSMFIDVVLEYADILEKEKDYEKIENIAYKAIEIDKLEEDVYKILIKALYYQKEYAKAMEIYKNTAELLFKSLGVKVSREMEQLYEMIKKENHDQDSNIEEVVHTLEDGNDGGAFFCEYGTFKERYNMQARTIGRLGTCAHFCLLTLDTSSLEDEKKKLLDRTMDKIQTSLINGLRMGDIISRFSVNQFVVLLPTCNYENANMVMDRVLRKVRYSLNHTFVSIDLAIEEVKAKE